MTIFLAFRQRLDAAWMKVPPGPRPWLRRSVYTLVVTYALYLVLGNLFLNTPLGPWTANRKPEKFQIHWGPGLTLWPGHVTIWDVKIKSRAGKFAWSANAGKVRAHAALLPLLHKKVQVREVWATELDGDIDKLETAPPRPAPRAGGWELQFDRIATDTLRRARFGELVLAGSGSAEVGFYKQLRGGAMELMPSKANFKSARLTVAGDEVLADGTVAAEFAIARVTREQAPGIRKLLFMDAHVVVDGKTASLDVTVDPAGRFSSKTVPGVGTVRANLDFARGSLKPGGMLRLHVPVTGTNSHGARLDETLDVALDVGKDIVLKAKSPDLPGGILALDADLRVAGNLIPLQNLDTLLPRTSGHVVGRWQFTSLRWVGRLFANADMLTLDGAGSVDIDARIQDGKVAAGSRVAIPDVAASIVVMGNRFQGAARAEGRIDAAANGRVAPKRDLVMEKFVVSAEKAGASPYIEGQDLRLDVETLRGVTTGQIGSGVSLAQAKESFKAHLTFNDARVPDLRAYNQFLPSTHMRFDGGSGRIGGDLTLDAQGDIGQGWLQVNARAAKLHMADVALSGDVDIHTKLHQVNLTSHAFNIDGSTIELRNISYSEPGGETRAGWWTKITLANARMDWDKPIAVDGRIDIAMKDVGFLLSLFSRKADYPKWINKLVDAGQAQVNGKVQWHRDTLVLDQVQANNDRFELAARLRMNKASRGGSLYARWGILSVGVDGKDGERDFKLVNAKKWYDAQPDLLR